MQARNVNKALLKAEMRKHRGGRQKIADAAGCSPNTVSNWLRPDYEWGLEERHAQKVAAFLGVNINKLFPPVAAGGKRAS